MDQDLSQQDELNALRDAMRERLRQKADQVLEAVEQIEAPKTFLEVERAARAIIATDKMIIQIFSVPKAVSYDMRFGTAGYDDEREHIGSRSLYDDKTVDAPIVSFSDTSPLRCAKGEDKSVEAPRLVINDTKPVSGRLTKRQKRRQRAFKAQTPTTGYGSGLSP